MLQGFLENDIWAKEDVRKADAGMEYENEAETIKLRKHQDVLNWAGDNMTAQLDGIIEAGKTNYSEMTMSSVEGISKPDPRKIESQARFLADQAYEGDDDMKDMLYQRLMRNVSTSITEKQLEPLVAAPLAEFNEDVAKRVMDDFVGRSKAVQEMNFQAQEELKSNRKALNIEADKAYKDYTSAVEQKRYNLTQALEAGYITQEEAQKELDRMNSQSFSQYNDNLNEINDKYLTIYGDRMLELESHYKGKIEEEYESFKDQNIELTDEEYARIQEIYKAAGEELKANELEYLNTIGQIDQDFNNARGFFSSLGRSISGISQSLNIDTGVVLGDLMKHKFTADPNSVKGWSDLLDINKVQNTVSELAGSMTTSMGAAILASYTTGGLGLPAVGEMLIASFASFGAETFDIAGQAKQDVIAQGGSPVDGDIAWKETVDNQFENIYLYSASALPFVPKALSFIKPKAVKIATGGAIEWGEEFLQEKMQTTAEMSIMEFGTRLNASQFDTPDLRERIGAMTAPTAIFGAGGQLQSDAGKAAADQQIALSRTVDMRESVMGQHLLKGYLSNGETFVKASIGAMYSQGQITQEEATKLTAQLDEKIATAKEAKDAGLTPAQTIVYDLLKSNVETGGESATKALDDYLKDPDNQGSYAIVKTADGRTVAMTEEQAETFFSDPKMAGYVTIGAIEYSAVNMDLEETIAKAQELDERDVDQVARDARAEKNLNEEGTISLSTAADIDANIGKLQEAASKTQQSGAVRALEGIENTARALAETDGNFVVHKTAKSFNDAVGSQDSRGAYALKDNTIHVNLEQAQSNTAYHEGTHQMIADIASQDPGVVSDLESYLRNNLSEDQVSKLNDYVTESYGSEPEAVKKEEFVAEAIARITDGKFEIKAGPKGILDNIINFIKDKLGVDLSALSSTADSSALAKSMINALRTGKPRKETKKSSPKKKSKVASKRTKPGGDATTESGAKKDEPSGSGETAQDTGEETDDNTVTDPPADPEEDSGIRFQEQETSSLGDDGFVLAVGDRIAQADTDFLADIVSRDNFQFPRDSEGITQYLNAVLAEAERDNISPNEADIVRIAKMIKDEGMTVNVYPSLQEFNLRRGNLGNMTELYLGRVSPAVPQTEESASNLLKNYAASLMDKSTFSNGQLQPNYMRILAFEAATIENSAKSKGLLYKAPNGADTNLTPEQWVMVRTKNFKRWFGDWEKDPENASKVLDENGEPLVVYHGTGSSFNEFQKSMFGGHFFSDNQEVADDYKNSSIAPERHTKAVFLNLRKPHTVEGKNRFWKGKLQDEMAVASLRINRGIIDADGMVITNAKDPQYGGPTEEDVAKGDFKDFPASNIYNVFDATAIKYADRNVGTFSSKAKNMMFQHVTPETSESYANMTEDHEGNYVFYHYGDKGYKVIMPSIGKSAITSPAEKMALAQSTPIAQYYVSPTERESVLGERSGEYMIKIPKEKVYDGNNDMLNLLPRAKQAFYEREGNEKVAFGPNQQMFMLAKVAADAGFDMTVVRWGETTKALSPKAIAPSDTRELNGNVIVKDFKPSNKFTSNKAKGWTTKEAVTQQDRLDKIYQEISDEYNKIGEFSKLYHLKEMQYYSFGDKFAPFSSQEEVSAAVNASEVLSKDQKNRYNEALESQDEIGSSVRFQESTRDQAWVDEKSQALETSPFTPEELEDKLAAGRFAMMTAENPNGVPASEEDNAGKNAAAKKWLEDRGYTTHDIVGKYGDSYELSFFVPESMDISDVIDFAREFDQESVATDWGLVYKSGKYHPRMEGSFSVGNDLGDNYSVIKLGEETTKFGVGYDFSQTLDGRVDPDSGMRFQASYSDPDTGMTYDYDVNSATFREYQESGIMVYSDIRDFEGENLILHSPDSAFSGRISSGGKAIVEGMGGMMYPMRFHDQGYFWAATKRGAAKLAEKLNAARKANNGRMLMGLTSSPDSKVLSSTVGATGAMDLVLNLADGVGKSKLKKALINAAVKQDKRFGSLGLKIPGNTAYSDVVASIREKLLPENSTFNERRAFIEGFAAEITPEIRANEELHKSMAEMLRFGAMNPRSKALTKAGNPKVTAASLIDGLGTMMTEPMLRSDGAKGKLYAVLELNDDVVAVQTNDHPSYPFALKSKNDEKTRLHIMSAAPSWAHSVINQDGKSLASLPKVQQLSFFPTTAGLSNLATVHNDSDIMFQKPSYQDRLSDEMEGLAQSVAVGLGSGMTREEIVAKFMKGPNPTAKTNMAKMDLIIDRAEYLLSEYMLKYRPYKNNMGLNWLWFRKGVQDKRVFLKKLQQRIEKEHGKVLSNSQNPYQKLELENSKTNSQIDEFLFSVFGNPKGTIFARRNESNTIKGLLKEFNKGRTGPEMTMEGLFEFMYLQHVKERNARGRENREKAGEDTEGVASAGMTDTAGKKAMASFKQNFQLNDQQVQDLRKISNEFRERVIKERVRLLRDAKIISSESADALLSGTKTGSNVKWLHYMPLPPDKRMIDSKGGKGAGRGTGIKSFSGLSNNNIVTIVDSGYQAIFDMLQAISLINNNESNLALLDLLQDNPSGLWKIEPSRIIPTVDEEGQITGFDDFTSQEAAQDGIKVYDNGKVKYILFNDPGLKSAFDKARSVNGFASALLRGAGFVTSIQRNLITQYNLGFAGPNFMRDMQESLANISNEADKYNLKRVRARYFAKLLPAALTIGSDTFLGIADGALASRVGKTKMGQDWLDAKSNGMKMSWANYGSMEQTLQDLKKKAMNQSGLWKSNWLAPVRAVVEVVAGLNDMIENTNRLAIYSATKQELVNKGWSEAEAIEKASSVGKNISLNFEKKGSWTPYINAFYLFFNAGVQGAAKTSQLVTTKQGRTVLTGAAMLGYISRGIYEYLWEMMGGDDENNPYNLLTPLEKRMNWVFMNPLYIATGGDEKYADPILIPKPYSLMTPMVNIGESAYDISHGKSTVFDAGSKLFADISLAMDPITGGTIQPYPTLSNENLGMLAQGLAPDVLIRPLVQIGLNKTWFGGKIYPDWDENAMPKNRAYPNTPAFYKQSSQWLYDNSIEGFRINVSPEVLEFMAQEYNTGVIKESVNTIEQMANAYRGDEVDRNKIIALRRFAPDLDSEGQAYRAKNIAEYYVDRSKFNQNLSDGQKKIIQIAMTDVLLNNSISATQRKKYEKVLQGRYDMKMSEIYNLPKINAETGDKLEASEVDNNHEEIVKEFRRKEAIGGESRAIYVIVDYGSKGGPRRKVGPSDLRYLRNSFDTALEQEMVPDDQLELAAEAIKDRYGLNYKDFLSLYVIESLNLKDE